MNTRCLFFFRNTSDAAPLYSFTRCIALLLMPSLACTGWRSLPSSEKMVAARLPALVLLVFFLLCLLSSHHEHGLSVCSAMVAVIYSRRARAINYSVVSFSQHHQTHEANEKSCSCERCHVRAVVVFSVVEEEVLCCVEQHASVHHVGDRRRQWSTDLAYT